MDFVSAHHGAMPASAMSAAGPVRASAGAARQARDRAACHAAAKVPSHCVVTEFKHAKAIQTGGGSARRTSSATRACGASTRRRCGRSSKPSRPPWPRSTRPSRSSAPAGRAVGADPPPRHAARPRQLPLLLAGDRARAPHRPAAARRGRTGLVRQGNGLIPGGGDIHDNSHRHTPSSSASCARGLATPIAHAADEQPKASQAGHSRRPRSSGPTRPKGWRSATETVQRVSEAQLQIADRVHTGRGGVRVQPGRWTSIASPTPGPLPAEVQERQLHRGAGRDHHRCAAARRQEGRHRVAADPVEVDADEQQDRPAHGRQLPAPRAARGRARGRSAPQRPNANRNVHAHCMTPPQRRARTACARWCRMPLP